MSGKTPNSPSQSSRSRVVTFIDHYNEEGDGGIPSNMKVSTSSLISSSDRFCFSLCSSNISRKALLFLSTSPLDRASARSAITSICYCLFCLVFSSVGRSQPPSMLSIISISSQSSWKHAQQPSPLHTLSRFQLSVWTNHSSQRNILSQSYRTILICR